MKQWYACSGLDCEYKTKEYSKEVKIKEIEKENGYKCPKCGQELVYNAR